MLSKRVKVLTSFALFVGMLTMPSLASAGFVDSGWGYNGSEWEFEPVDTPEAILGLAPSDCWDATVSGDETDFTVSIDATAIEGIDDLADLVACVESFTFESEAEEFDPDVYGPLGLSIWLDLEGDALFVYECMTVEVSDGGNNDYPAVTLLVDTGMMTGSMSVSALEMSPADFTLPEGVELNQATFYGTPGFFAVFAVERPAGPAGVSPMDGEPVLRWEFDFSIRPCGVSSPRFRIMDPERFAQQPEGTDLPDTL